MTGSKSRDYLFDNLKGLLIFCVVYAHFLKATAFRLDSPGGAMYCIFFCFIMQAFLFVSGYFSKNLHKSRAKAVESFLFPYVTLTLVMYVARVFIFGYHHASLHFIKPSMALWYLLVLFFYRYGLKSYCRIPFFLPLSFILSLGAGLVPFLDENLSLGRVFGFLPFFVIGYCCTSQHVDRLRKLPTWIPAFLLITLPLVGIYIAQTKIGWNSILFKRSYEAQGLCLWQGMLERGILTVVALGFILVFLTVLPRTKTFLSTIGQGTMPVFALHILVRYLIQDTQIFGEQTFACYLALFLCAAITTWTFSRPVVVHGYHSTMSFLYRNLLYLLRRQQRRIRYIQRRLPIRI